MNGTKYKTISDIMDYGKIKAMAYDDDNDIAACGGSGFYAMFASTLNGSKERATLPELCTFRKIEYISGKYTNPYFLALLEAHSNSSCNYSLAMKFAGV